MIFQDEIDGYRGRTGEVKTALWDLKNVTFFLEQQVRCFEKEVYFMKGYVTAGGYMGYVDGDYVLFASEDDYREYFKEN